MGVKKNSKITKNEKIELKKEEPIELLSHIRLEKPLKSKVNCKVASQEKIIFKLPCSNFKQVNHT